MAIANQERVGKALDFFRTGLAPYVEREFAPLAPSFLVTTVVAAHPGVQRRAGCE